jgi:hypothetical protein
MSRTLKRLLGGLLLALLAACAAKSLKPVNIGLAYQPSELPSEHPRLQSCAALSALSIEDARSNKEGGQRLLERQPEVTETINWGEDALPWFQQAVAMHQRRSGLQTEVAGKPEGTLKLEQLSMTEKVHLRAAYDGRVVVSLDLRAPTTGKTCWSARVTGFAENRGYPGTGQLYNDTLNQALDKALIQLLSSTELTANLCGKCGS